MKTVWTALLVAGLVAVAGSAYAGAACCASKAKEDKAAMGAACSKAMADLDLSAEQKAKIDELQASCKAEGCSKEACAKSKAAIRDVLNDDQKAKFDAACEAQSSKKAGGGCG